ncbi:MAG: family 78 glycoside hydrolase catalytic domain [Firmicutes bacterium]|nr:family 78 glycoside hydrolase catalytic domain [Bacillota bacterium]
MNKGGSFEWKALWIWGDSKPEEKNCYQAFRHKFNADEVGSITELYISADSRYVLFLNGERLGQGPVRSWPAEQSYDVYDITSRVRPGENTLAVMVHYYGVSSFQYIAGRGGLLCQIDTIYGNSGRRLLAKTDESWRTTSHPAYERKAPRICCQLGFEERFDARRDLRSGEVSWVGMDYPDGDWGHANVVGPVGTAPWLALAERSIPFLTEEPLYPVDILSVGTVKPASYRFSIDLHPLFFPEKRDANRETIQGALVFAIEVDEATEITWHQLEVYGFGGLPKVGGQHIDLKGKQEAVVSLEEGSNLVVIDLCGGWHDLVCPFAIESDRPLKFVLPTHEGGESQAVFGFVDGRRAGEQALSALLGMACVDELVSSREAAQHLQVVPDAAVMDSIFAATACRTLVEAGEVALQGIENLFSANSAETIIYHPQEGLDVELLLDFGREIVGFLEFEISCPEGVILDFNCFEGIQEGRWLFTGRLNNTLRYVAREGRQFFHSHVRRGFRYAALTIRNFREPVRIGEIRCLLNTYPVSKRASFRCSDYLLNEIWEMCRYTSRLCSEDTYVDCPAYEQAFWVGDARNEALIDYYVNGDYRLARRCLQLVAKSLERSPLPESQVPSGWQDILTAWSLLWMIACREHYQHTGDREFLQEIYPALRQTSITFIEKYLNEDGLLEIEAWNMLDWAPMDTPEQGVVTHQNAWLVRALRETAELAAALGGETEAEDYKLFTAAADRLKEAINRHLWSEEHQAFVDCRRVDGTLSSVVSQQTNTVVYLCDCVDGDRKELLAQYVKEAPADWVTIGSPFMMFFSFEALAKQSRFEEIVQWTRRYWGMMLDRGATTCWEMFPGYEKDRWTRSFCHAWSAAPGYFLPAYQLGVRTAEPGFAEVVISPEPAGLEWCEGIVPSPKGDIKARWEKGEEFSMQVEVPQEVACVIELPAGTGQPRIIQGAGEIGESAQGRWQVRVTEGRSIIVAADLEG